MWDLLGKLEDRSSHDTIHFISDYCDVCKKQFNSYQAFWSHNMQVHQVHGRPHKCGTCAKTFVFQHSKINHEKTHVEGRLVYCCDQEGCDSM